MIGRKTVSQCVSEDYCKGWNDAVDKMPKWISVKERLPENDDDVLIITEFGISMGCYVIHRDFWVYYTNPDSNIVTHWMPLPEPPKEDAHEG